MYGPLVSVVLIPLSSFEITAYWSVEPAGRREHFRDNHQELH